MPQANMYHRRHPERSEGSPRVARQGSFAGPVRKGFLDCARNDGGTGVSSQGHVQCVIVHTPLALSGFLGDRHVKTFEEIGGTARFPERNGGGRKGGWKITE